MTLELITIQAFHKTRTRLDPCEIFTLQLKQFMAKLITSKSGSTIIVSQQNYYCEGLGPTKLCPDKKISERKTGCEFGNQRASKTYSDSIVMGHHLHGTLPTYNLHNL